MNKKLSTTCEVFDLELPHNEEAETAIIENICFSPQKIKLAASLVDPLDFYSTLHRKIFGQILEFHREGKAWNLSTLKDSFIGDRKCRKISLLIDDLMPRTSNLVGHNARLIRECSDARWLIAHLYEETANLFAGVNVGRVKARLKAVLEEVAHD